jgi:hypothetical protein
MGILFTIVPIGIVISVIAFIIFENRALKAKREKAELEIEAEDFSQRLEQYDTLNNTMYFGVVVYIFSFIIANVFYSPEFGLVHALMYIFITTFLGSGVLFLIKIKKELLIKVFAAFLYGVAHIIGASFAFLTRFLLS